MGAITSCNCAKGSEKKNEIDLEKEKLSVNPIQFGDNKNVKNNFNTNDSLVINFYNREEEKKFDSKNIFLGEKFSQADEVNYGSSPGHLKQFSQDLKLEINDDNLLLIEGGLYASGNGSNKNIKKFSNPLSDKSPLEVINEINVDNSKDSQDGRSLNLYRIKDEKLKYQTKFQNSDNPLNGNVNENVNNKNKPARNFKKDLNRKINKSFDITSIIPENVLLNCDEDEILFQSELKKLFNSEITAHSSQLYSTRYCVFSKSEFKLYKSKEQFLMMSKPLNIIPLINVIEANIVKGKANSKMHFVIKISNNNLKQSLDYNSSRLDTKNSKIQNDDQNPPTRGKKISLIIDDLPKNLNSSLKKSKEVENSENLMIFTSDKDILLEKWNKILNYFLSK